MVCPAGTAVFETAEGSACRCKVEEQTITFLRDPSSLVNFCMGLYTLCPSWQAEKGRIEEGTVKPLVERDDAPPTFAEQVRGRGGKLDFDPVEVTYFEQGE